MTKRLLLPLAIAAVAILVARGRRRTRTSARSAAARAWAEAPSAPQWYVPVQLPIDDYDDLRAADIAKAVRQLERPDEVQQVLEYEEEHSKRVTVFKAAKSRLRALQEVH